MNWNGKKERSSLILKGVIFPRKSDKTPPCVDSGATGDVQETQSLRRPIGIIAVAVTSGNWAIRAAAGGFFDMADW